MASVEQLLDGEPEMFRSLVVLRRYKVIYYVTDETIYVADIWDCRQDPAILKESTTRR